jgi:hypothetical protein
MFHTRQHVVAHGLRELALISALQVRVLEELDNGYEEKADEEWKIEEIEESDEEEEEEEEEWDELEAKRDKGRKGKGSDDEYMPHYSGNSDYIEQYQITRPTTRSLARQTTQETKSPQILPPPKLVKQAPSPKLAKPSPKLVNKLPKQDSTPRTRRQRRREERGEVDELDSVTQKLESLKT